jgi:peptidoglycan/LPS O-acetylase OafA/YrhL
VLATQVVRPEGSLPPTIASAESLGAQGKRTIPGLDGVRGLAAALVFLVHYQAAFGHLLPPGMQWVGVQMRNTGYNGVNVFFVLSGFLIYGSLISRETPLARFLLRRVRRIYPTYWAVLALYLAIMFLFPSYSKLPVEGAATFVLANVLLLPGVFPLTSIVTVAWTLSFEIFFYLSTGLGVRLFAMRRWSSAARLALIVALLLALLLVRPIRMRIGSFVMFLPGVLLAELSLHDRSPRRLSWMISLCVAAIFIASVIFAPGLATLAASTMDNPAWSRAVLPALSFSVLGFGISALLFVVINHQSVIGRVFALRPVRYTGLISYSFYLIHGITLNTLALGLSSLGLSRSSPANLPLFLVLMVPSYLLCLGTATLLFRAVERRYSF